MNNRIVLCCDGTWNSADQVNEKGEPCATNVLKVACRTKKHRTDGSLQIVYYDQGVGTGNAFDRATGGAFGEGLEANINDAYRFLVANYEPGDLIYLFGFSRGAFTARSIAGMIRRCGILRREKVRMYPKAKETYKSAVDAQDPVGIAFRKENAIELDTPIHCIAVWDTVGALGIPLRGFRALTQREFQFHDTNLSKSVKYAFHALAVDEHRGPFAPAIWKTPAASGQIAKQAWFAGAHSDVGGGYEEPELSDLALDWMMNCAEKEAGLEFDDAVRKALDAPNKENNHKGTLHNSKTKLYRLTPGLDREIGKTPTEYFHRSVLQRWRDVPDYRPKSLQPYAALITQLLASPLDKEIYPVAG